MQPERAFAGAWMQPKDEFASYLTVTRYKTAKLFDRDGKEQSQSSYQKTELNGMVEYGYSDDLTIGGAFFLQQVAAEQGARGIPKKANALIDPSLHARYKMPDLGAWVTSLQTSLTLPDLMNKQDQDIFGPRQMDVELRALMGRNFDLFERRHFVNLEGGYRHRLEEPGDEWRFDSTLGIRVSDRHLVLLQWFETMSVDGVGSNSLAANSLNYDLTKLQASYVVSRREWVDIQVGAFMNVRGRNTGAGHGFLTSLWFRF